MPRRQSNGTIDPVHKGGFDPTRHSPQKVRRAMGGNSRPDKAFCEDEAESLLELDAIPDGLPWDIKYQWQAYGEDLDPEYWEQFRRPSKTNRTRRDCTGISYVRDERGGYIIDLDMNRLQRPCLATPILGANVCQKHGGQVPQVKEAAQVRLAMAAEKAATTLITLTDPRDELNEIVDQKVRVSAANSVLDRVGIKAGSTVEVQVPGYKQVMDNLFSDAKQED